MKNSIEEDIKVLEGIIKGDEDCINAIYSQMKVKKDNDEDIQYYKKEIQSIKNIVDKHLKEKARADKLEKEYSKMLTKIDEYEVNYIPVSLVEETINDFRDKTVWGYNDWKYDENVYKAELNIIDKLEEKLLEKRK